MQCAAVDIDAVFVRLMHYPDATSLRSLRTDEPFWFALHRRLHMQEEPRPAAEALLAMEVGSNSKMHLFLYSVPDIHNGDFVFNPDFAFSNPILKPFIARTAESFISIPVSKSTNINDQFP